MSSFSSGYQDVFERPLLCREARTDLDKSSKHTVLLLTVWVNETDCKHIML